MKKLFIIFSACLLLLSVGLTPTKAESIYLTKTDPMYDVVEKLFSLDLTTKKTVNKTTLKSAATREDVVVILSKALGLDGTQRTTAFKDVPKSSYASGYIQSAVEAGIVSGYTDGTFKPNQSLTRAHIAVFIMRAFNSYFPYGSKGFKDVPSTNQAASAIQRLVAAGIISGYPDGTFKPDGTLTYEHLLTFVNRTVMYLEKKNVSIPVQTKEAPAPVEDYTPVEKTPVINTPVPEVKEPEPIEKIVEAPKVVEDPNKIYTTKELTDYLNANYSVAETKLTTVKIKYQVYENTSQFNHYDYKIEMDFNASGFEVEINKHLNTIIPGNTSKDDIELSRNQLKGFIEKLAQDSIQKAASKKILGANTDSGYRYKYIREGRYSTQKYSWTNYEPIAIDAVWPGNQPEDYYQVYSLPPSDPLKIRYSQEESQRRTYETKYSILKYQDMKITSFGWRDYLNSSYYSY